MKIYLAAHYSRKAEVIDAVRDLEKAGVRVVSTWHLERMAADSNLDAATGRTWRRLATRDIKELRAATCIVFFSFDGHDLFTRGGHCVELGYAIAKKKRIVIVGPFQNIFCYLKGVKRFEMWDDAFKWLKKH